MWGVYVVSWDMDLLNGLLVGKFGGCIIVIDCDIIDVFFVDVVY